jgi:hypothetical protein
MIIYNFRITLDYEKDVIREIEVRSDQSFFEFHKMIIEAFEFNGDQMCSFFMSNKDWDKGEEIMLFDMGFEDNTNTPRVMENTQLTEMIAKRDEKILYVYDFLRMWVFLIELTDETILETDTNYPRIVNSIGNPPDENEKSLDFEMPVEKIEDEDEEMDPELRDLLDDSNDDSDFGYIDPDDLSTY